MAHKDIEFAVGEAYFKDLRKALEFAFVLAASRGEKVNLDVLISSRAGARKWAGEDGVERYEEDPEASVFERYEIKVNDLGRVP